MWIISIMFCKDLSNFTIKSITFFFIKKKDCLHQKVCWVGNGYQSAILNWILCTITPLMFWKDLSKFYIFTLTKWFSLKLELKWTPVYHFKLCEFVFYAHDTLDVLNVFAKMQNISTCLHTIFVHSYDRQTIKNVHIAMHKNWSKIVTSLPFWIRCIFFYVYNTFDILKVFSKFHIKIFVYIQSLPITEAERKLLFPSSRGLTIHSKGDFTHLVGRMVSNLASHCKGLNWVPAVGDLTVLVQKKVS